MSTPLDAYWQHEEGQRSIVTKPWFLLRPNGYVIFFTTAPRFSFPSELQEDRLNLELCWAGNHWFNFPKALFQILFYFPELTHWTPNPRKSLEKAEHGCLCFCWVGFNSEILSRLSFPGVLLPNIPNCGGFLDMSSKLHIWSWSLLIVCPQSEKFISSLGEVPPYH